MEEKKCLSKSKKLKDYKNVWKLATNNKGIMINYRRAACCREDNSTNVEEISFGDEYLSWPPKSYTCGFCKREFKSAQALGGHMNVHRREKAATLRQIITHPHNNYYLLPNNFLHPQSHQFLIPNPNPNLINIKTCRFASNTSSIPTMLTYSNSCGLPLSHDRPCLLDRLLPSKSESLKALRSRKPRDLKVDYGVVEFSREKNGMLLAKKPDSTGLLFESHESCDDFDLDLELRLGWS